MKYTFLLLVTIIFAACAISDKKETPEQKQAREQREKASADALKDSAKYTTIEWIDSATQNLGNITQGNVAEITWKFKNIGNYPLFVSEVQPTCGCTVAEKPEAPVAPGELGIIKAKYNSQGAEGHISKHMNVIANIKNNNNGNESSIGFTAEVK